MFYTYILQSEKDGRLYIGQTSNLEDRLLRHNQNRNISTKNKGPWIVLWSKKWETRSEAMKLEIYLKSLKNKEYL
jgi:putative endonuclease